MLQEGASYNHGIGDDLKELSGSAGAIGRASASGNRKSWERTPIDYATRELFLPATTIAAEWGYGDGAPIDSLPTSALPAMLEWKAYVWEQPVGPLVTFLNPAALSLRKIVELSPSDEGQAVSIALRNAVVGWMQRHNFKDDWIGDCALQSLLCLAIQPTGFSRTWPRINLVGLRDETRYPTFAASISVSRRRTSDTEYETCKQQIEREFPANVRD
jgi:hypothetical protein